MATVAPLTLTAGSTREYEPVVDYESKTGPLAWAAAHAGSVSGTSKTAAHITRPKSTSEGA